MDAEDVRHLRAQVIGYRVMLATATEALLYIENEAESKTECQESAHNALDDLGESS